MNELKAVPVSRCLDKKMMIMGFEVPDLLIIFLTMSVLNFLFGSTPMQWLLVWLPSATLAGIVRFSKRGKPENYLVHWLRFQIKPGVLCAFMEPTNTNPPPKLYERKNA